MPPQVEDWFGRFRETVSSFFGQNKEPEMAALDDIVDLAEKTMPEESVRHRSLEIRSAPLMRIG